MPLVLKTCEHLFIERVTNIFTLNKTNLYFYFGISHDRIQGDVMGKDSTVSWHTKAPAPPLHIHRRPGRGHGSSPAFGFPTRTPQGGHSPQRSLLVFKVFDSDFLKVVTFHPLPNSGLAQKLEENQTIMCSWLWLIR